MIGEYKFMRTVSVRNDQAPGVLGRLLLALSNPVPEIDPDLALSSGAAFATDGKIVNTVLRFPGILRGAVDSNARRISDEMYLAAADTIAPLTPPGELLSNPLDKHLHQSVAAAVAKQAIKQGLARAEFVTSVNE
jgi:malate dehydrogenase (oxaloacetate-decarboxylating)